MSLKLEKAHKYEKEEKQKIAAEEKPAFHVTPPIGWMNDPNGFSFYDGEIHLFYQYHPYTRDWGPMHWGHCVSKDMVSWEMLPAAMAPDQEYDAFGCFSGSAIEADGKHALMYTGVSKKTLPDGTTQERQNQCLAYGDGRVYEKFSGNPVITGEMMPKGCSRIDFRDPKIWKEDGKYYLIVGNKNDDQRGQVVLFSGKTPESWEFETVLAENSTGEIGTMWECPDFFGMDGKHFLICSPQDMKAQKYEFHNGNNAVFFVGEYDKETHVFKKEAPKSLDYGFDFYAPQTTELPDGRRIMIAWMKSWDACVMPFGQKWQGMMTIPRELKYVDGKLYQNPVEELKNYRKNPCVIKGQEISGEMELEGICGRVLDMTVEIGGDEFDEFSIELAHNEEYTTNYTYHKKKKLMTIDRTYCGVIRDVVCHRTWELPENMKESGENLKLRFIMDRQSVELFVNDGAQAVSTVICTPPEADGIVFSCDGKAKINIEKYEIAL